MSYRIMPALLLVTLVVVGAQAQEPNLTYQYDSTRMEYPLTPSTAFPSTPPVYVPTYLPGNSNVLYWSCVGVNNGAASTPGGIGSRIYLDGGLLNDAGYPYSINAGSLFEAWDKGPFTVRGGRHTLGIFHDPDDEISESNEGDNWWAHQFMFAPYFLVESTPVQRGEPPMPLGGVELIVDGSLAYYNCDGFRFSSSGWWSVVTLRALDDLTDYDLEIFNPSTGPESGFINPFNGSFGVWGLLDAIIVNRNTMGVSEYDIGVLNAGGSGDFVIEQVASEPAWVGVNMTASFGLDEHLKIWDTYIGQAGWVTATVVDSLGHGIPFKVGWFGHDTTVTSLYAATEVGVTDMHGAARVHLNVAALGYYGLAVYRDADQGNEPVDLTVIIEPTSPDLRPETGHHWYAPLVPRPVLGGVPIDLPDTLHGYIPETYLSVGVGNISPVGSPSVDVAIYLDGMDYSAIGVYTPPLGDGQIWTFEYPTGLEYPGGRHTLIMDVDFPEAIYELNEGNNLHGEQFCWSPMVLSLGGQYGKGFPGPAIGGLMTLDHTGIVYLNCDGYRLHTGYAPWEGVVLTQGPNSDYDLAVHHPLEGVKNGFDDVLSESAQMAGHTDYVVFNNSQLGPQVFDLGVSNYLGWEPYTVEAVASTTLPIPPTGTFGPHHMGITHMLHLHDIYLQPDIYAFRLDNLYGSADWSIALHAHDDALPVRSEWDNLGWSNQNGPGGSEWFTVDVPVASYYCLAVCKATPFGFDLEGEYELTIMRGVSDVQDEPDLPVMTALGGVWPNPFNPQTTIAYELAAAAEVELAIYNLKGARVRRLVNGPMPVGRHETIWNGADDAGSRVASGVYMVRFTAGAHREVMKVVMVK